jgi:magnesium transporter
MGEMHTLKHKNIQWINISHPNEEDIKHLEKKYKFHHLDLEDCLSKSQRPKIDEYDNYLFIVLDFPVYHSRTKRVTVSEIKVFIGQGYLITLHEGHGQLEKIFEQAKKNLKTKKEFMGQGTGFLLYELVSELFDDCFPILNKLTATINELEQDIFEKDVHRDMLNEILIAKKDIINFRRMIIPQRSVVAQLEHKNKKFLPETLEVYFDDVVDKIEKLWSSLENLKELIESLQDTNESVISHNTNNVIKTLTIFSVVMLPLTFITGFYGMNVALPFDSNPTVVHSITALMIAVVVGMLVFFKIKKWI